MGLGIPLKTGRKTRKPCVRSAASSPGHYGFVPRITAIVITSRSCLTTPETAILLLNVPETVLYERTTKLWNLGVLSVAMERSEPGTDIRTWMAVEHTPARTGEGPNIHLLGIDRAQLQGVGIE